MLGLLAVLWLLFVASVSAQTETPTDTPTPTPTSTGTPTVTPIPIESLTPVYLYETPTIAPTLNYGCPGQPPNGWLTVTPNAWWDAACGECFNQYKLTPTGTPWLAPTVNTYPTLTGTTTGCYKDIWGNTICSTPGTSTPTLVPATPTPTQSPTPVPTGAYTYFLSSVITGNTTLINNGQNMVRIEQVLPEPITEFWWFPESENITVTGYVVYVEGTGGGWGFGSTWALTGTVGGAMGSYPWKSYGANLQTTKDATNTLFFTDTQLSLATRNGIAALYGGSGNTAVWVVPHYPVNYAPGFGIGGKMSIGGYSFQLTWRLYYLLYGPHYPYGAPTATPEVTETPAAATATGTPSGDSVCNNVIGYDPSNPNDDPVIIPIPSVGGSACMVTPYVDIDLSALSLVTGMNFGRLHLDQINVCLKAITLGTFNLFGMGVSLDAMLMVLAGIFFIRLVMGGS